MNPVVRDDEIWLVRDTVNDEYVRVADASDSAACKCCAFECEAELTISVSFCGMDATVTLPIPGFLTLAEPIATLPDDSYILMGGSITCTPCGWFVDLFLCAFCVGTEEFASDGYTAFVPFSETPEDEAALFYCPAPGNVELECFGDQFGIPCITTVTAVVE